MRKKTTEKSGSKIKKNLKEVNYSVSCPRLATFLFLSLSYGKKSEFFAFFGSNMSEELKVGGTL